MDILLSIIIVLVLGLAIAKILIDRKKGSKCSSCPYASVCIIDQQNINNTQCEIDESEQNELIPNA